MTKRTTTTVREPAGMLATPGLAAAPVMDLMCSHFVLTLAALADPIGLATEP